MKKFSELYSEKACEPKLYIIKEADQKPKLDFLKHFDKYKLLPFLDLNKKYNPHHVNSFYCNVHSYTDGLE